jgi:hypothetical protein
VSNRPDDSHRNGFGRGDWTSLVSRGSSEDALDMLARRTYATYLARLRTANRTRLRGQLWNLPLVTSPVVTLIVAVVSLNAADVYSDRTDLLLVVLSVLTLVASIIVPSADYAVSAERLFTAYRGLQRLSVDLERESKRLRLSWRRNRAAVRASHEYQEILDRTQNHSGADHWGVIRSQNVERRAKGDDLVKIPFSGYAQLVASWSLTALPVALTLALVPLLFPAIRWIFGD